MQFDLIVDGPPGGPNGDYLSVSQPALVLQTLSWDGDTPPDLIILEQGTLLIRVGRFATAGNKYSYRVANTAHLIGGSLQENTNAL